MNNISKAVLENNMLIAKFMGLEHENNGLHFKVRFTENISRSYSYKNEDFKFDISWDWLMPVVDKIEGLEFKNKDASTLYYDVMILPDAIIIQRNDTEESLIVVNKSEGVGVLYNHRVMLFENKKIALYEAVVEFITFFNKLKNK